MKTTRYLLMLLMALMTLSVKAQQRNVLMVPDVAMSIGHSELPVSIENTAEIAGIQFDIKLPEGVSAGSTVGLTERCDGYSASIARISNNDYRVVVFSNDNHPIQGQSGVVMHLPVVIPAHYSEGTDHELSISNAVLAKASGENVITETITGKIHIMTLPDLTVKNVSCDVSEVNPGERMMVSWQVENLGEAPTVGGWSEQISLISEDGMTTSPVAAIHYVDALEAGGIISRQAEITVPGFPGIDGNVRIQVRIVPDPDNGESTSTQANNIAISTGSLFVGKVLAINLSPQRVNEDQGSRIALTVYRSGSWAHAETFALTSTPDSRVSLPEAITVPAGQSGTLMYLSVTDNFIADNDSIVNITVSGNDYPEATASLIINDNELPYLSLVASKEDVGEGESFTLTIWTNRISSEPIDVSLSCDLAKRFSFPKQVAIPAGELSVTVDILAVDNDEIEIDDVAIFKASAYRHESGECEVAVADNDMPTFTFSLSPESVSESDGATAFFGVIRRTDNLDKRVTIKLSDNAAGLLSYSSSTIVLEKNQSETQFYIGVVDNSIVDGDHNVTVTAAVYVASCNCSLPDDSKGTMTANVIVLDDDGPALKIKPEGTAMLEGSQGNIFTISHNTNPDSDITVRVSSDHDDILEYNHELIIPAGQTTVQLLMDVKSNDMPDDSSVASFKVEADGYTPGTCWLLITDQTLPDAVVSLTADKTEAEAGDTIALKITVKNIGNSTLGSSVPVEISFSGTKGKVRLATDNDIAVGDSTVIEYDYTLPAITGTFSFVATVNSSQRIPELLFANNSSEKIDISLLSPFTATAKADKDTYKQGDNVIVSGTVSGNSGKNADIEVYLINNGSRQTFTAKSDSAGNYSVNCRLLKYQAGQFAVGACYPSSKGTEEMDAFYVYGLKPSNKFNKHELGVTDTVTGKIKVINPGDRMQSGFTVTPKSISDNCEFTFDIPDSIGAGESIVIGYTIKGNVISSGPDFQEMKIEIATEEGSRMDYTIYYYVHPQKAKLESDTKSINTTMTYGIPREYPLTIRNVGKKETGKITLALPDWIQPVTPREIASLAQGDSTTIVLRFNPTEAMQLNVGVHGRIGINCANGDGIPISFKLTPVSETKGTLKVDVTDEYTYFTDEAPHVGNAEVTIQNPTTGEIVAQGFTSGNGKFVAELPEGYYRMSVVADKHDSYENLIIVDPGVDTDKEVFISYQAVSYSWDVVETEIEDEYEIETVVTYETRVPKPVVVITLPSERPEPYSIVPVIVTNHGLVNALNLDFYLSVSSGYTLEFMNETSLDVLGPEQSHVFYAKLLPSDDGSTDAPSKSARSAQDCLKFSSTAPYDGPCKKNPKREEAEANKQYGPCLGGGGSGGGSGDYWPHNHYDGPGHPHNRGNKNYDSKEEYDNPGQPLVDCTGNSPKVPSVPIDLGIVPDKPIEEGDCDEKPVLVFKLIPVTGTRYNMRGVAADGVSQVKIVLDPDSSRIPSKDCKNFYAFNWNLSKDSLGTIDPISEWEAIYTAPASYPNSYGSSMTVTATLSYAHRASGTMPEVKHSDVKIEIVRPPVVFIHGLGDNRSCWYNAEMALVNWGLYKPRYNYRADYRDTNTSAFMDNNHVVDIGITTAKNRALSHGYVATKCDLVGHSMGGLLARLYVERLIGNKDYVNRIITLNTPHAGSELGDMVMDHPLVIKPLAEKFFHNSNLDAVENLGVESVETALLVNVPGHFDIPVFALGTESDLRSPILMGGNLLLAKVNAILFALDLATLTGALADPEPITKIVITKAFVATMAASILCNEASHYLNDDYSQIGDGDLIVSNESQIGGCSAHEIIKHGPWHVNSPKDYGVIGRISQLLTTRDSVFSTDWFSPKPRNFKHNDLEIWLKRPLNLIPTTGSIQSLFTNFHIMWNTIFKSPGTESNSQQRVVTVNFDISDEAELGYVMLALNGEPVKLLTADDNEFTIPSTFSGEIGARIFVLDNDNNVYFDDRTIIIEEPMATPIRIEADDIDLIANESDRLRIKCYWDDGSETFVTPDNVVFRDKGIAVFADGDLTAVSSGNTYATMSYGGLSCEANIKVFPSDKDDDDDDEASESVCSTITLSFKQKSVMTRQAFRGTLTVNNGNKTIPMTDVKLNLQVRDTDGNVMTAHEFQIDAEKLAGFKGELDLASGWSLGGGETGMATVLFIPTKYAAPTEPKDYSFGGTFSYIDPYTGLSVTRELNPVTLTVNPSPNLELTYFMQRDVFGDDPLTKDIEPMVPSEFALLVNNIGYGDAENLSLLTKQPEIIDNQKGLAITMEIISSQLNGGETNLALGGSVTSDFGTVPAHSQAYAQWWLQSSLLGHFIDYDVKATQLSSHDNPDLSLLDDVTIHELIRGFTVSAEGDKPLRGFLVNDIKDKDDMPDAVYFTDGSHETVFTVNNVKATKISDTDYEFRAFAGAEGWNYGSILDPTYGKQKLVKVMSGDGTEINVDNFWQTDRTLRDNKDPLYENRLHFVGNLSAGEDIFHLTFEPKPDVELEVKSFGGVSENGSVLKEQLREVIVVFNKPVREESFSTDDITLHCQGTAVDVSQIAISKVSESEYKLGLSEVTLADGFYVLTVQTTGILDTEGFGGSTGKKTSWIQYVDGKVALKLTASPAEGGSISPKSGRFDYDSDITVKANPAEGYDFTAWMLDNVIVSADTEYTHHLMGDTELTALFSIKHYNVLIDYDSYMGVVEGASSGIYEYGTLLDLVAIPYDGFVFDSWLINSENVSDKAQYTIRVNSDISVDALFKDSSDGIESVDVDDLNVKIKMSDSGDIMYISGNFDEILMVNIFNMRGTLCVSTQNVDPDEGVSTGHLNTGIYYVQVMTDRGLYSAKILKR